MEAKAENSEIKTILLSNTNQSETPFEDIHFTPYDYSFFGALLSFSVLIGIYYGFFSKHKQNSTQEYMLGGKTMKIIPVAISLIAS